MNSLPIIASLMLGIPALGAGFQFPSCGSCKSPDGKWELGSTGDKPEFSLRLRRFGGRTHRVRLVVDSRCNVLWSPDSAYVAINDPFASDMSRVFILWVAAPEKARSVGQLFRHSKTSVPGKELNGHCYFQASKWLGKNRLLIRISGHTDEAPTYSFEHEYVFDVVSGGFRHATSKKPEPVTNAGFAGCWASTGFRHATSKKPEPVCAADGR